MLQLAHFLTIGSCFDNPIQNCLVQLSKFQASTLSYSYVNIHLKLTLSSRLLSFFKVSKTRILTRHEVSGKC